MCKYELLTSRLLKSYRLTDRHTHTTEIILFSILCMYLLVTCFFYRVVIGEYKEYYIPRRFAGGQ